MSPANASLTLHPYGHKIRARHLERLAIVYVRQSTPQQVADHRESADLQYQLRRRAVDFGWPEERVLIIDDDQGCSGQTIDNRLGFQRLLAEISLDHVGIVFGREMSRLARSNKDWHQLLELCAVFQVLLADADGVYDPSDFNDRLLLGLKGTMSEAELHILKARMHQGKLNKARRGELFTCVPLGYVRAADGSIALDPDEQVRSVVRLIFEKFAELGSVPKVHAYFVANGIRTGLRVYKGPERGRLEWHKPRRRTLYEVLRHPIYAGAYVYGRYPCDRTRSAQRSKVGRRTADPQEWVCLLKDRVPAYITWEQYEANRRRMQENAWAGGAKNVQPGKAPTLLNGRIICGSCGRPMTVRNARRLAIARYRCDSAHTEFGEAVCQSIAATAVDRVIAALVLQAVQPAALELSLRAAEQVERDRERVHEQWRQKLERAEYEAGRARRQYDVVDPENRLVARELERQWEQRLSEWRQLQEEYTRFQHQQPRRLTAEDRKRIRDLAADVPALWRATTTTGADRRAVVRQLIERVEVMRHGTCVVIDLVVHWRGGQQSRHTTHQGTQHYEQLQQYDQLRARVTGLRGEGLTGEQIAEVLNREGYRPARGGVFTGNMSRQLLVRFGLVKVPAGVAGPQDLPGRGEWWLPELARELGVAPLEVHQWRWTGWIHARQLRGRHGRVIVWADRDELKRLRRLRDYLHEHRFQHAKSIPASLKTPKPRPKLDQKK
jgi:DNA invertase Pin-like site-specific DNA recombinase